MFPDTMTLRPISQIFNEFWHKASKFFCIFDDCRHITSSWRMSSTFSANKISPASLPACFRSIRVSPVVAPGISLEVDTLSSASPVVRLFTFPWRCWHRISCFRSWFSPKRQRWTIRCHIRLFRERFESSRFLPNHDPKNWRTSRVITKEIALRVKKLPEPTQCIYDRFISKVSLTFTSLR